MYTILRNKIKVVLLNFEVSSASSSKEKRPNNEIENEEKVQWTSQYTLRLIELYQGDKFAKKLGERRAWVKHELLTSWTIKIANVIFAFVNEI